MILLGVTGSVAAYKAVDILRLFMKAGEDVHVLMTPAATQFVGPLTFQSLSGHPVMTDILNPQGWQMAHLDLPERSSAFVIAPASAESLSRLSQGSAEDILSASALSVPRNAKGILQKPIFLAPAMHEAMWKHPATQAHVATVKTYGYRLIGPERGALGRVGDEGEGRMSDPEQIVKEVLHALSKK
jgi:phosphopantothenoylcysteine decarboxylase/phosphopantothenate--cysteine ligase